MSMMVAFVPAIAYEPLQQDRYPFQEVTAHAWCGTGARLVDIALDDGSMFTSDGWKHIEPTFSNGTVHFIGLASDGGVHSRLDQVGILCVHVKRT
jgi:bisphosphoglycerate-independent phosphoglycerate mutase (AlkP superfamily)